jgi:hypothetical protein
MYRRKEKGQETGGDGGKGGGHHGRGDAIVQRRKMNQNE